MRKKLLRSGSGFEKPESREEAIMQNILGASNVLEPSESNIEEILKSILYNTPYTKEAEFEIEKILLAIKNNGTYDGEGESRDMKILIAILKGLDYTEEAQSRIEELFIEWHHQRSSINVLEGIPPLTFVAKGEPLINYEISGNMIQSGTPTPDNPIMPEGVGERTANLWNRDVPEYDYVNDYKKYNPDNTIALKAGTYTVSSDTKLPIIQVFDNSHTQLSVSDAIAISSSYFITWDGFALAPNTDTVKSGTIILLSDCILTFAVSGTLGTYIMLNLGSTALPYEPYGYKIPIISAGQTNNIYIGSEPLRKAIDVSDVADTITYSTQQLIRRVDSNGYALATPTTETINVPELPTNNGTTVIDVDTTVKPSNVYIEYK